MNWASTAFCLLCTVSETWIAIWNSCLPREILSWLTASFTALGHLFSRWVHTEGLWELSWLCKMCSVHWGFFSQVPRLSSRAVWPFTDPVLGVGILEKAIDFLLSYTKDCAIFRLQRREVSGGRSPVQSLPGEAKGVTSPGTQKRGTKELGGRGRHAGQGLKTSPGSQVG